MRPLRSIEASPRRPRTSAGAEAAVGLPGRAARCGGVRRRRFAAADARGSSRRQLRRAVAHGAGAPGTIARRRRKARAGAAPSQAHDSPSRLSSLQIHRLRARAARQASGALCYRSASLARRTHFTSRARARARAHTHAHTAGAFLTPPLPPAPAVAAVVPGCRAAAMGAASAGWCLRFD